MVFKLVSEDSWGDLRWWHPRVVDKEKSGMQEQPLCSRFKQNGSFWISFMNWRDFPEGFHGGRELGSHQVWKSLGLRPQDRDPVSLLAAHPGAQTWSVSAEDQALQEWE